MRFGRRIGQHWKLLCKRAKRWPMRQAIAPLCSWQPISSPVPGYTIVIGCMQRLLPVAAANLRLVQRASSPSLREIIVVFDCAEHEIGDYGRRMLVEHSAPHPVRAIYYSQRQRSVLRRIDWGWCYAWLSWCLGIAAARTEHVLLHDLDALPLDPSVFERLYARAVVNNVAFQGLRRHAGVPAELNLVTTFEMVLRTSAVRNGFRPIDAFNRYEMVDGRAVDFDTLLWIQDRVKSSASEPLRFFDLLHPSQMICHHTDLLMGRPAPALRDNSLCLLPYYSHLADGDDDALTAFGDSLTHGGRPLLSGRVVPVGHISPAHWAFMEKVCRAAEHALFGCTRPAVERFLAGFVERAGSARTVGMESADADGVPML